MCNVFTNIKRTACFVVVATILSLCFFSFGSTRMIAYAETSSDIENEYNTIIDKTLNDIDSSGLDDYLNNEITSNLFDVFSFKDIVNLILTGELFLNYNSLADVIIENIRSYFLSSLKLIIILLVIVILFKLFETFCADKYLDIKRIIRIIFTLIIVYVLAVLLKGLAEDVKVSIEKAFEFCKLLFPILLSLVLSSGASVSYTSYGALSIIILETFSYIFVYILIPLSISIMVFSLASFMSSKDTMSKIVDLLKNIFKYIVIAIIAIFGLFSSVSAIGSGMKDGISLKITKYAIKNYVPVLGGYISDGFDFIKSSSVIIKNAFGLGGIIILFFNILSPIITYICYVLVFKFLSIIVSFFDEEKFSKIFNNVSKSISYFLTLLAGLFLILLVFIYMIIISVSVV